MEKEGAWRGPSLQGTSIVHPIVRKIETGARKTTVASGASLERHSFLWYLSTSFMCSQKHTDINHINWAWWYHLLILVLRGRDKRIRSSKSLGVGGAHL